MNKNNISKCLLVFSDFISLNLSLVLALFVMAIFSGQLDTYIPSNELGERFLIHFFIISCGVAWFAIRLRHYTYRKPFWLELKEILRTLLILAVIELATFAFSKMYLSCYLWGFTWIIALIITPFSRVMIKKALIKSGIYLRPAIIIGGGKNAIDAYKALNSETYLGFNVKYFITEHKTEELRQLNISILDESRESLWKLKTKKTDQFIIALEDNELELRDRWLKFFSTQGYRSVSVIPTLRGLPLYSTDMSFLFSYDMMLLRMNNNLAKRSSRILKRMMDIIGSVLIILALSLLLLALYFIIRRDGGDAIYGHERIGQNGKPFKCLKFRSMVTNSKEVLDDLLANNAEARAEWEKDFKLKNDPRITKIGRLLRKTSLDELPQLFNVLKGEMSLVGPRPIVQEELERYHNDVSYYLMAKPGMTGLWQVSGRNDVDYDTRVYFDSWYVKNWSLWNDIAILFKTINVVFKRDGAY